MMRYLFLLALLTAACRPAPEAAAGGPLAVPDTVRVVDYDFSAPAHRYDLPRALQEISGLTVLDARHLGAVQDEDGDLFTINIETGAVDKRRFAKRGDFEGLANADGRVFALRTDGKLYELIDWRAEEIEDREHETKLDERYDPEGLTYDAANNRLLVICKEFAGKGYEGMKAIYAFDLGSRQLEEDPVITIDLDAFTDALASADHPVNTFVRRAIGGAMDMSGFLPSGLALHPQTRHLYILSSKRKAMLVIDLNGHLLAAWTLDPDLFPQPEGLAFLPDGTLFVSSEGRGGRPRLYRFDPL